MYDDSDDGLWFGAFSQDTEKSSLFEALYEAPKTPIANIPTGASSRPGVLLKALSAIPKTLAANIPTGGSSGPGALLKALSAIPKTPVANIPTGGSSGSGALVKTLWANSTVSVLPIPIGIEQPAKTTAGEVEKARERFQERLKRHQRGPLIALGRVVPNHDDLPIGNARRLENITVLFLDICNFSRMNSETAAEQENVHRVLDLFMAEMLGVVQSHGGEFEKNTGDGFMAYFAGNLEDATRIAVDAAITMHCYNDRVVSPGLKANGLPEVQFRIGIDS